MSEIVLPEKYLLEKAPTIKRFEYSPLGSSKWKLILRKMQYQGLG